MKRSPWLWKKNKNTPACWEGNALSDTNFPLRREVPSRNRYHIFPQYASLRTGSTSWHEREINQSKTHPSTFAKTHACARLHTTVRSVAFISQNKVSLWSRGIKKKQKKNQNNRNYIWCLIVWKNASTRWSWHDRMTNTSQIWGKELKTQDGTQKVRAKKENPTFLFLAAEPQSGFYEKLHPVLHLGGRRSSARVLLLAWQRRGLPRLHFFIPTKIRRDTLKTLAVLHLWAFNLTFWFANEITGASAASVLI